MHRTIVCVCQIGSILFLFFFSPPVLRSIPSRPLIARPGPISSHLARRRTNPVVTRAFFFYVFCRFFFRCIVLGFPVLPLEGGEQYSRIAHWETLLVKMCQWGWLWSPKAGCLSRPYRQRCLAGPGGRGSGKGEEEEGGPPPAAPRACIFDPVLCGRDPFFCLPTFYRLTSRLLWCSWVFAYRIRSIRPPDWSGLVGFDQPAGWHHANIERPPTRGPRRGKQTMTKA